MSHYSLDKNRWFCWSVLCFCSENTLRPVEDTLWDRIVPLFLHDIEVTIPIDIWPVGIERSKLRGTFIGDFKAAQQPRHVPILLIHASGDQLIPIAHAHQIVAAALRNGIPLDTYFVEHPTHCGAYGYVPECYTAKLRAFVAKHLSEKFSGATDT